MENNTTIIGSSEYKSLINTEMAFKNLREEHVKLKSKYQCFLDSIIGSATYRFDETKFDFDTDDVIEFLRENEPAMYLEVLRAVKEMFEASQEEQANVSSV